MPNPYTLFTPSPELKRAMAPKLLHWRLAKLRRLAADTISLGFDTLAAGPKVIKEVLEKKAKE